MLKEPELAEKLETVFDHSQAVMLAEVVTEAYQDLVKTGDFNELKGIVKDLAGEVKELAGEVKELAEAQQRTEIRMGELAEAQQRTEQRLGDLAGEVKGLSAEMRGLAGAQKRTEEALQELAHGLGDTRAELGGLSRSVSYALENEAYRALPAYLQEHHGIVLRGRLIRTEVGGEEVNLLGQGVRDGEAVVVVGETKLRLDERRDSGRGEEVVWSLLERKVAAVRAAHPGVTLVPVLITHYARPSFQQAAQERGVIVVQSFEWG